MEILIPENPMEAVTLGIKLMMMAPDYKQAHGFAVLASCIGATAGFTSLEMSQAAVIAEAELIVEQYEEEEA